MFNLNSFANYHFLSLNEDLSIDWKSSGLPLEGEIDINSKNLKPYELALDVVDAWLEGVKEETEKNIEGTANKKIFSLAFNRIAKKIFPSLISYIIPSFKFQGKDVIKGKDITPQQFWKEAWPKVWNEFSGPEKLLIKEFTILSPDTTYDEVMAGLAETLSDGSPYSGYKQEIADQANAFYEVLGNSFSQIFNNEKVSLSNNLVQSIFKDLNSRIRGSKIDFMPSQSEEISGKTEDASKLFTSPNSKKSYVEIAKTIDSFSSELAKSANEPSQSTETPSGSSSVPPATDVQSVRKWAKDLDKVTKQIIVDTIRSTM